MVGATIQNMLDQSLAPYEIIVVDDGSTDDSVKVIGSFGDKVKLIKQTNQGPGAARNAGLSVSKGEFIQFMDSDDLASKNKLEVQLDALKSSGADFAYCPWIRCFIDDTTIKFQDKVLQAGPVPSSRPMLEWFVSGWSLVFQNCLFRRSALDKAGYYRTDLMPSEDSEFFIRILLKGAVPVHTPGSLVFYREHNVNKITASGTSSAHRARDWTKFLTISGELLSEKIADMHLLTRLSLATSVNNHLKYCKQHHIEGLPEHHPYKKIPLPLTSVSISIFSVYQKLMRYIKKSPDFHIAFSVSKPDAQHTLLASQIGYN
jgi:glycosyltransferase involved in cell wall biosynthesis